MDVFRSFSQQNGADRALEVFRDSMLRRADRQRRSLQRSVAHLVRPKLEMACNLHSQDRPA